MYRVCQEMEVYLRRIIGLAKIYKFNQEEI
jgi:hypothetical protein